MGVKELELSKLVTEMIDAQLRAEKMKSAFETINRAIERGQTPVGIDEAARTNSRIQEFQRRLDDAELRLEIAQARSGDRDARPKDPLTKEPAAKEAPVKDTALADLRVEVAYLEKKLGTLSSEVAARSKTSFLEEAQARSLEAESTRNSLAQRVEALKRDLGDLSNAMVTYNTMQEEQKGLRDQLKTVRQQIEQVLALQTSNTVGGIRWHMMPEAEGN